MTFITCKNILSRICLSSDIYTTMHLTMNEQFFFFCVCIIITKSTCTSKQNSIPISLSTTLNIFYQPVINNVCSVFWKLMGDGWNYCTFTSQSEIHRLCLRLMCSTLYIYFGRWNIIWISFLNQASTVDSFILILIYRLHRSIRVFGAFFYSRWNGKTLSCSCILWNK